MITELEHRIIEKDGRASRLNFLTKFRLNRALKELVEPHATEVAVLSLTPGSVVEIAQQSKAKLMFVSIDKKWIRYKTTTGKKVPRRMSRYSFGWRFDIYSSEYWTRNNVGAVFSSSARYQVNVNGISMVQGIELAVHDKKKDVWYIQWYSLGHNKDSVMRPRSSTLEEPRGEPPNKQRRMIGMLPIVPNLAWGTQLSLASESTEDLPPIRESQTLSQRTSTAETIKKMFGALIEVDHMEIATEIIEVTNYLQHMTVDGEQAGLSMDNYNILIRHGSERNLKLDSIKLRRSKELEGHKLISGHRVVFHTFPIGGEAGNHQLIVANVFDSGNDLFASFCFGAMKKET